MQPTWVSKDAQTFLIALLVLKFIGHNIIKLFGELQFYCIGKEKQVNYNYLIVGHNQGAAVLYMAKQFSPQCTAQHYRDVHVSHFTCHISCVTCLVSHVTCHMSRFMCHLSRVMCHMSPVTCHLSPVACPNIFLKHFSFKKKKKYHNLFFTLKKKQENLVELVGGGSVINGAYPVQL